MMPAHSSPPRLIDRLPPVPSPDAAVVGVAVVGAAVLTWRLSQGPIVIDAIAPAGVLTGMIALLAAAGAVVPLLAVPLIGPATVVAGSTRQLPALVDAQADAEADDRHDDDDAGMARRVE